MDYSNLNNDLPHGFLAYADCDEYHSFLEFLHSLGMAQINADTHTSYDFPYMSNDNSSFSNKPYTAVFMKNNGVKFQLDHARPDDKSKRLHFIDDRKELLYRLKSFYGDDVFISDTLRIPLSDGQRKLITDAITFYRYTYISHKSKEIERNIQFLEDTLRSEDYIYGQSRTLNNIIKRYRMQRDINDFSSAIGANNDSINKKVDEFKASMDNLNRDDVMNAYRDLDARYEEKYKRVFDHNEYISKKFIEKDTPTVNPPKKIRVDVKKLRSLPDHVKDILKS